MEKPNGMECCFIKSDAGLYYLDTAAAFKDNEHGMSLLMTVEDKQSNYMVRAY